MKACVAWIQIKSLFNHVSVMRVKLAFTKMIYNFDPSKCNRQRNVKHPWLLGYVFSWQSQHNKKHNTAGPALPSSLLCGKLVSFDHVFCVHHSGLARCSLCDKPSDHSDLSRQLHALEERQERVMETRREQQCKFCCQAAAAVVLFCLWIQYCCGPSLLICEEKAMFNLFSHVAPCWQLKHL